MKGINSKTRRDKYKIEVYGVEIHVLVNYSGDKVNKDYTLYSGEDLSTVDSNYATMLDGKGMLGVYLKNVKLVKELV